MVSLCIYHYISLTYHLKSYLCHFYHIYQFFAPYITVYCYGRDGATSGRRRSSVAAGVSQSKLGAAMAAAVTDA